ncbi:outer membrane protein assembly factor BamA [Silvimonas amylolytica]|uniref:Outer membrane protein assembly factor BamA n=1 Tax=Silvimonas amylolytica TaxID=449663 RepID=A0ABQ2PGE6_9NEIS|nr:outer membrane protein assembly factor BamA [Silvimonas amylolytica]GGP24497.1 outer membrane protein assembly factor BamA [Silvimonas amylolytica]
MKLKPLSLMLGAALSFSALPVWAIDAFVVKDIRVEGLQRTDAGTVFNYLPVKVGESLDDDKAQQAIKALYATGFFNDVRLERSGDVLIVTVDERPTIAQININGAKLLDKDQIKTALKSQNFAEGRIFDQGVLDAAVQELKQQYYSRGRYSLQIKTSTTRLERNRVGVQFDISEGATAVIQQVNLVGANVFKESKLLDEMSMSTPGWFSWYTRDDQYSRQKMTADLETLRSYYMDRGYLEFNIDSTQVAIGEDKESVFLTINLTEGPQYTVSDVKFAGESTLTQAELEKIVNIKPGEIFNRSKITKATTTISGKLGNDGYAFANVNAVPEVDKVNHTVSFTFYVDPGRKVYVRNINITGNSMTRDEVVRRELRQLESAQYDASKVDRSKQRLNQLDYFQEVTIDTPPVPESPDQVDMNVKVTEKKTGQFNIGAGYGQSEGVVLIASVSQTNFLGSGKAFSAEFNNSSAQRVYSLGLSDPYATPDGISMGWNFYKRDTDPSYNSLGNYTTSGWGGALNFGLPVTEFNSVGMGLAYDNLEIITNSNTPKYVNEFVNEYGSKTGTFSVNMKFGRDTRDSASYPTRGWNFSTSAEAAIPSSDLKYYRLGATSQYWIPFGDEGTALEWNLQGGYGGTYGNSTYPFFKNYYAGGVNSVRGFAYGTIGPKDENGDGMGGNRMLTNSLELFFPMPGLKNDKSTRLSLFLDSGLVRGPTDDVPAGTLRYSTGASFSWVSPIGPLKFSLAKALKKDESDKMESFQFQIGNIF